jgi:hypothetical protein
LGFINATGLVEYRPVILVVMTHHHNILQHDTLQPKINLVNTLNVLASYKFHAKL